MELNSAASKSGTMVKARLGLMLMPPAWILTGLLKFSVMVALGSTAICPSAGEVEVMTGKLVKLTDTVLLFTDSPAALVARTKKVRVTTVALLTCNVVAVWPSSRVAAPKLEASPSYHCKVTGAEPAVTLAVRVTGELMGDSAEVGVTLTTGVTAASVVKVMGKVAVVLCSGSPPEVISSRTRVRV